MSTYKVLGKSLERSDARNKVTGAAEYTTDMHIPGMTIAKAVRCPYAHAKIISMNKAEVEALPGVIRVVTWEDLPRKRYCTAGYPKETIPGVAKGVDPEFLFDKYILDQELHYEGEIAAVVVAENEDIAEAAALKLNIEYEELPFVTEIDDALAPDAPFVHGGSRKNVIDAEMSKGDVEEGFKQADHIFEDTYFMHPQQHVCMEPCCTIAKEDPSGRITVWSTTQVPYHTRRNIAETLDIPISKIRVIKPTLGGGFGERQMVINEILLVAITRFIKRPVKMIMTRQENLAYVSFRHEARISLKTGVKNDGSIVAYQMKVQSNAGAYTGHSPYVTKAMATKLPYRIPNVQFNAEIVFTNRAEGGAFRGYGNPQMAFARETHLDRIAEALNLDPVAFRRLNVVRVGEANPVALKSPWILQSNGLEECLDKGMEAIGWDKPLPSATPGKLYGRGLSCSLHVTGTSAEPDFSSAQVKVNEDGTVILLIGSPDLGQGSDTAHSMICAETLGVRYEDIYCYSADTDVTSFDMGSYASRQTYVAGNAVYLAAQKAKEKLIRFGSEKTGLKRGHLNIKEGWLVRVENEERIMPLAEVAYYGLYQAPDPEFIDETASYSALNCPPAFGADFCELEVDEATGAVNILHFVAAHDTGTAVNPALIEGQIEGCISQGIGQTFMEDMIYNSRGKLMNDTFKDYKVPRANDMPPITSIIVEAYEPSGPFGAKSVGEMAVAPVPGAIVNALYQATGVRFTHLPISKGDILQALKDKKA